jgi:hypothetical protein
MYAYGCNPDHAPRYYHADLSSPHCPQTQANQVLAAEEVHPRHVQTCFELVGSTQHAEVQFWALKCILEVRYM